MARVQVHAVKQQAAVLTFSHVVSGISLAIGLPIFMMHVFG